MQSDAGRRFVRFALLCALVPSTTLAFPLARPSQADEPAPVSKPAPAAGAATGVELVIGPEDRLTDVLKSLARITGAMITWSEQDKGVGTKKFVGTGTVVRGSVEQIFDTVRAMLANEEILLMRYGAGETPTYLAMDARTMASQFVTKMQPEVIEMTDRLIPKLLGQGGRFVTTTIRVANLADLRDARTALQRMVTQNNIGSVQEVPSARAFLVTDFAPNVALIYQAIRAMDLPPAPMPVADAKKAAPVYFALKHARAAVVLDLLERLFPTRAAPGPAPSASQPQPGSGTTPRAAAGADPSPRIWFDEATNQVIAIASEEDFSMMKEIVARVDVEPAK